MFDDGELLACLNAGGPPSLWCDYPDPVGWQDLIFAHERTLALIRQRIANGLSPARTVQMPLPKGFGDELRIMTIADPFDEAIYRTIVGRLAWRIDSFLGSEVQSYRLAAAHPNDVGWRTRDFGYAQKVRRRSVEARLADSCFSGLATLDVRNYYPTIDLGYLAEILLTVGSTDADVYHLHTWLTQLQELWQVRGVPVGPETSGLLGNAYLIPVDAELRALGFNFQRYSDDYRVWLSGGDSFSQVANVVRSAVHNLGLELNSKKIRLFESPDEVRQHLFNEQLDRLDRLDGKAKLLAAESLFDSEMAEEVPSVSRIKYCIGVFGAHQDPYGLQGSRLDQAVMRSAPRAWGRYIGVLHRAGKVDADWLADAALETISPSTAALRTHLLLACARGHNNATYGTRFCDLLMSSEGSWIPLRCAAAEAWMASEHWRVTRATEGALAIGDAQRRRAITLTLRCAQAGTKLNRALAKLRSAEPECGPAAVWIESGEAAKAA